MQTDPKSTGKVVKKVTEGREKKLLKNSFMELPLWLSGLRTRPVSRRMRI